MQFQALTVRSGREELKLQQELSPSLQMPKDSGIVTFLTQAIRQMSLLFDCQQLAGHSGHIHVLKLLRC